MRTAATPCREAEDKTLKLWEVSSGHCLRTFEGHTNWVKSVFLSADGRYALSGSWDETLRLWEVIQRPLPADLRRTHG